MTEAMVPYMTRTLDDTMTLGKVLAQSGYFADSREAAQAVVKILAGSELGFGPIASMTGVNIIKGKVTLSANLIAASIKRSGRYDYRVRTMTDEACRVEFYEGGQSVGVSEFSMSDAKAAGLATGDNWRKFPRNMLFARAISNGAKWYCPDLSGGPLYTPDELGATVDGETGEVIDAPVVVKPTPSSATVAPVRIGPDGEIRPVSASDAPPAAQDTTTPADLPFGPTIKDAVDWACKTAPQVWAADKNGVIVRENVVRSLKKLSEQGLTGDALALAWIAKVDDKLATFAAAQVSETTTDDATGWADVDAHGHDADDSDEPKFS